MHIMFINYSIPIDSKFIMAFNKIFQCKFLFLPAINVKNKQNTLFIF